MPAMQDPLAEPTTEPGIGPAPEPGSGPAPEPEAAGAPRPGPGDRPPGDRPPAGRLPRPPSARFERPAPSVDPGGTPGRAAIWLELAPAFLAGLVTAAVLVLVGGVLAERQGLLTISGLGGAAIGLLAARASVSRSGVALPALTRPATRKAAISLAVLAVLAGALGTWAYGRLEGGVMEPLAYLWATLGPFVPAEAVLAAVAAAWGAGAGPIRGGS
jgi:hypothetical protein